MKSILLFFILVVIKTHLFAQGENVVIPQSGSSIESFVPKGWKMILKSTGDLNKDGLADKVMVIENTNPKNIIANDGLGQSKLNLNPRVLLVLFKTKANTYNLAVKNSAFIPSENDEESTCLADPLMQEGGISIQNGLLKISYQYWSSCGSWYVTNRDYTFRFQNQKFELIGYDDYSLHRSSGEQSSTSINFSTKKMNETTGGNEFNDEENKPKTVWKPIKPGKLFSLATLTEEIFTDYLTKVVP
ncbi:hypothetical protein GJU39_10645 [Pedobacter petrophilus]|uniref:Uncharacterized protein n=1 Tax=Pedobacter petrophilus TaxID=1908241 RepID=A0A7K0FZC7_9SPHI|nr:hypothetical protein [Pedobacter petrophilus]MRX76550.1 hypothetical protein [Pedobacter petrophilus]